MIIKGGKFDFSHTLPRPDHIVQNASLPEQSQPGGHPEEPLRSRGRPGPPWGGTGSEWGKLWVPGLQVATPPAQDNRAMRRQGIWIEGVVGRWRKRAKLFLQRIVVWAIAFIKTSDPHKIIKALNIPNKNDWPNIQLLTATLSLSLFWVSRAFF